MRRRTITRLGAVGLVVATALSGLTAGPAAAAPATPAADAVATRMVGPLGILGSGTTSYGLTRVDDEMRTSTTAGQPMEALDLADIWSVPKRNEVGPVRGVGDDRDRCLTVDPDDAAPVRMAPCDGTDDQRWFWGDVMSSQGYWHTLVPTKDLGRSIVPLGAETAVGTTLDPIQRRPMIVTTRMVDERALTASARIDLVRREAVITGSATSGATVSAEGETTSASDDGRYTLRVGGLAPGEHTVTVTQSLADGSVVGTTTIEVTMPASDDQARMVGHGVLQLAAGGPGSFAALGLRSDTLGYASHDDQDSALAAAGVLDLPAIGSTGPVRGLGGRAASCLYYVTAYPNNDNVRVATCDPSSATQQWTWVESPTSFGESRYALAPAAHTTRALTVKPGSSYVHVRDLGSARPFDLSSVSEARALTADASLDRASGDVTVSGTGTPDADIAIGERRTTVAADGSWSIILQDLPDGRQTLTVTQTLASGIALDDTTLEVDVERAEEYGPVVALDSPTARLLRGTRTDVSFSVRSERIQADYRGTVTLTAPAGTTFPAQESALAEWRAGDSDEYRASPELQLRDGSVSDDGATLTFAWPATRVGAHEFRYTVAVDTPTDAADRGDLTLDFDYRGTSAAGRFRATGTTPVVLADSYVNATLDNLADGDTFTPGVVRFEGTGTPGARITLTPAVGDPVGADVDADGTWRTSRYLGNGAYTFTLTHVAAGGQNTIENIRLYSDQVAAGPLTVTAPGADDGHDQPGFVTFRGTGTTWSTISITDGTSAAPTTATVQYDGSWTAQRWVGTAPVTFVVTSTRAETANGEVEVGFNQGSTEAEFAVTSHTDGGTFTPGPVTISGTATTGDTVTLTANGLAPLQAQADWKGRWSVDRWLGNGFVTFTVTHTPSVGTPAQQTLRLFSDQGTVGEFVVTSPVDGDRHDQAGFVTFSGTGTTWSTVTVDDGRSAPNTASVQLDGSWSVDRWVGTAPITFTISSSRGGVDNGTATVEFNQADAVGDFTITSHADGDTFTPGPVTIAGTGSTGERVTMTAPGLPALEAVVDRRGDWSVERWLGNGSITFTVANTPVEGEPAEQKLRLYSDQVPAGPLTVLSPSDGETFDAAGFVTFSGTGTTWSQVSITDGTGAAPTTATVAYDGTWTMRRWVDTEPVTLTVTSTRADRVNGTTELTLNSGR